MLLSFSSVLFSSNTPNRSNTFLVKIKWITIHHEHSFFNTNHDKKNIDKLYYGKLLDENWQFCKLYWSYLTQISQLMPMLVLSINKRIIIKRYHGHLHDKKWHIFDQFLLKLTSIESHFNNYPSYILIKYKICINHHKKHRIVILWSSIW